MEDALRKELVELCQHIINNSQSDDLQDLLPEIQLIEEKLILYKYLRFRQTELERRPRQQEASHSPISQKLDAELEQTLSSADLQRQSSTPEPLERPMFAANPARQNQNIQKEAASEKPAADETPHHQAKEEPVVPAPNNTVPEPEAVKQQEDIPEKAVQESEAMASFQPRPKAEEPPIASSKRHAAPINLGLNDRISFTNNLFDGSQQDLNRVISQLNTFGSYREAETFINQMVKPDYDWTDKTDYEERLFDLVKARFGEG